MATTAGDLSKQVKTQNHGKVSFVETTTKFQKCHLQHDLYASQLSVESNQTFYSQIILLKLLPQGRSNNRNGEHKKKSKRIKKESHL